MGRCFISFAAVFGFSAVMLGAFGAHALQGQLTPAALSAYETAVQYQFWHTLALLSVAVLNITLMDKTKAKSRWLYASGWAFTSGIVLFSGSLYLLALTDIKYLGVINIGLITPLGGLVLLTAWACLFAASLKLLLTK